MTDPASRYDYQFDPADQSTAARVCRLVGPDREVLELGCAAGAMSAVLKRHYGCAVTGVEYDPIAARAAAAHCDDVVIASLDDAGWVERLPAGRRYDTVLAADVLEHLRDPARCLRQLLRLLPADGRLVVSVPNIAHSGVLAGLLCGDFTYADTGLLDRTHVHFFTAATLQRMLEDCGYEVLRRETSDAGAWHPEFKRYWEALPAELRAWLEHNPAGAAYQAIVMARPRAAAQAGPPTLETPTQEQAQWLRAWPSGPAPAAAEMHQGEPAAAQADARTLETPAPAATQAGRDATRAEYEALRAQHETLRASHDALRGELAALRASHSWRVTAPLRALARLLRRP